MRLPGTHEPLRDGPHAAGHTLGDMHTVSPEVAAEVQALQSALRAQKKNTDLTLVGALAVAVTAARARLDALLVEGEPCPARHLPSKSLTTRCGTTSHTSCLRRAPTSSGIGISGR